MPCDSQILNRVTFKEGTDLALLEGALKDAGYVVQKHGDAIYFSHKNKYGQGTFQNGTFTVPQEWGDMKEVKRAYSVRSVYATAKKLGWSVRQNPKDKNKLQMFRRY